MEILIIGNKSVMYRIASSDIWYITTGTNEERNKSIIYLTNGKRMSIRMPLTDVKKKIDEFYEKDRDKFSCVGSSLIINTDHLYKIDTADSCLMLFNRRADGFLSGLSVGYAAGKARSIPEYINIQNDEVTIFAPKDRLSELKSKIYKERK